MDWMVVTGLSSYSSVTLSSNSSTVVSSSSISCTIVVVSGSNSGSMGHSELNCTKLVLLLASLCETQALDSTSHAQ